MRLLGLFQLCGLVDIIRLKNLEPFVGSCNLRSKLLLLSFSLASSKLLFLQLGLDLLEVGLELLSLSLIFDLQLSAFGASGLNILKLYLKLLSRLVRFLPAYFSSKLDV